MSRPGSWGAWLASAGLILVIAALPLAGCTEVESESAAGYEPSKLQPAKGDDGFRPVVFTREGASRTGVRTAVVRRRGKYAVLPYAALLYGPDGTTYVYTSPKPLRYIRQEVEVDRIDGDRVLLSDGPARGTRIVTVGAAEVYGTELEVSSK